MTATLLARTADDFLPLKPVVFHVLLSLAEGERHGYAIMQDISERENARMSLEPGNLYRHLKFMLDEGLIQETDRRPVAGRDDERRRYYQITRLGRQVALAETTRLEGLAREARSRLVARGQGRS
jgi:DNA-binding PadR family transcriptional regulator